MTAGFGLCDDYVTRSAELDPVAAGMQGLTGVSERVTGHRFLAPGVASLSSV